MEDVATIRIDLISTYCAVQICQGHVKTTDVYNKNESFLNRSILMAISTAPGRSYVGQLGVNENNRISFIILHRRHY